MNRYLYPTYQRPTGIYGLRVGSVVNFSAKGMEVFQPAHPELLGKITKIDHNTAHVVWDGHDMELAYPLDLLEAQ
jgi:hypothetical protein